MPPALVGTHWDPLTNLTTRVSELVAQWPAALEQHQKAVHEEAVHRAHERAALSRPPVRIHFDAEKGVWTEEDARDPADVSPGLKGWGVMKPTPNELREAQERAREVREDEEQRQAAYEAWKKARREPKGQDEIISIQGHRVRARNVRFHNGD